MGSTYTDNGGIEKIGLGEQAGAWGTTTNNNFDIIDRLVNGVGSITLSGTTHTLTTSDGSLSDGMFKVLVLGGSPSGTNTVTIEPNNADKLYFIKNSSGQSAIIKQGSGATVTIANGSDAVVFADGAGSGAAVTEIKPSTADASVLTATLADSAVTTAKIADDAVTAAKIADDAVGADAVADNSIGAAAINISGNGTSGQAVVSDGDGSFSYTSNIVPSGALMPFAGASAPTGFLLCDGSAISRSTYSTLFSAISTTYGAGDGSSTFNLPDLRGRVIAGQDDMGGSSADRLTDQTGGLNGDTLGATGGSETHTLTTAQLASHTHSFSDTDSITAMTFLNDGLGVNRGGSGQSSSSNSISVSISGTTGSAGSGSAHNNVQPTIILNYIIKT
jgi:microcystin-dependent protein